MREEGVPNVSMRPSSMDDQSFILMAVNLEDPHVTSGISHTSKFLPYHCRELALVTGNTVLRLPDGNKISDLANCAPVLLVSLNVVQRQCNGSEDRLDA